MSICKDDENKLKYTELKYCRCEYVEATQPTQDPEKLQISICRDKESKVKYTEIKYCRC